MHLKHVALRAVKPCEYDQLVAGRDADKPLRYPSRELQPSLRSAFVSLERRLLAAGQLGAYYPYWFECIAGFGH
jgi:hypothetical protein